MARIPNSVKAWYKRLDTEDSPCYYCGQPGIMDDLTPNPKASEADLQAFVGDKVQVRSCRKCWAKIYTANIAYMGHQFHVPMGCMTLEQKLELIGVKSCKDRDTGAKYMVGFDRTYVAPIDTVRADDFFVTRGHQLYSAELQELQGPLALRLLVMPDTHVEAALMSVLQSNRLDPSKEAIYREILELEPRHESI